MMKNRIIKDKLIIEVEEIEEGEEVGEIEVDLSRVKIISTIIIEKINKIIILIIQMRLIK